MPDSADEINDLHLDIKLLRTLIDLALDRGAGSYDLTLRALAEILYERQARLDRLENAVRWAAGAEDDLTDTA
jgi:hypothetical protein